MVSVPTVVHSKMDLQGLCTVVAFVEASCMVGPSNSEEPSCTFGHIPVVASVASDAYAEHKLGETDSHVLAPDVLGAKVAAY